MISKHKVKTALFDAALRVCGTTIILGTVFAFGYWAWFLIKMTKTDPVLAALGAMLTMFLACFLFNLIDDRRGGE